MLLNGMVKIHHEMDKLVQSFREICLFTGQYNTKGYGTIIDVISSVLLQFIKI